MTIRRLAGIYFYVALALLLLLGAVALKAYLAHVRLLETQQLRVESYMLAEESRRSLDLLTRYARTFVVTGDEKYARSYAETLAIRRGEKAPDKNRVLWDLGLDRTSDPRRRAVPFHNLAGNYALTPAEEARLAESYANSVALERMEERAMAAARGLYPDASGHYTKRGPKDRAVGLNLLYGEAYHREREHTLEPLNEYLSMVDGRTATFLAKSHARSLVYLYLVGGFIAVLSVFVAVTYRLTRRRILEPVEELQLQTERVAADLNSLAEVSQQIVKGDYDRMFSPSSERFPSAYADEVGDLIRRHNDMLDRLSEAGHAITDMTTDLSRAKGALGEAHAQLKGILTAATQVSIIATDLDGVITLFNAGAEKLLGYTSEEMVGRKTPEIIHLPGEMEERGRELSEQLGRDIGGFGVFVALPRGGAYEQREWTYRRKDGTLVPVELVVTTVTDRNGKLTGYLGIAQDISARKRAEAEMRKLWQAVESSPVSIVITDREGKIEYVNPKFSSLTGYSGAEVFGQNPRVLKSGELPPERYKDLWLTITAGGEWRGEFHNKKKNGELFWESASISPIKDSDGGITHFVAVKEDITERKAAEAEVRAARDAAVELARMKSEFLANMSHEIRTPMNAIIGMTGLLQDTPLTAQQADYVATVNNAGEALLDIINDILDFSKMESGKMTVEHTVFQVREAVENTMELAAHRARAAGLEIAFLVEDDVPHAVKGDPGRLRQVLLNLVTNAVKFTPKGEVVLNVSAAEKAENAVELKFSVRDTGIGIPKEVQGRLFQVFSQADASTTRKYGGTGLGLAISKRLVELMGGAIGLESEPGAGSTFWFTLPVTRAEAGQEAAAGLSLNGVRTLIVDDNEVNRYIVGRHLEACGARHDAAASGEEALELLLRAAAAGDPYQLAVLDMQMPGMDGLTLAARMAAEPVLAGVKKVMLTSLGSKPPREESERCGLAACLFKPVRPGALCAALCAALTGEKPAPRGEAVRPAPAPRAEASHRFFRVLVAEDNPVNQKLVLMQLEKAGYRADSAGNGLEVLEAMKRIQYDLILMDCQMPEMDGYQATAEIRRLEGAGRRVPVVAMTANAMEGDKEKCLAAGMDDYLPKPVRFETLLQALRRWDMIVDGAAVASIADAAGDTAREFMSNLMDVYLADARGRLGLMREAASRGDSGALAETAHALKGASANMGAKRVESLSRRLEALGRSGAVDGAAEMLEVLAAELEAAAAELAAARDRLPS